MNSSKKMNRKSVNKMLVKHKNKDRKVVSSIGKKAKKDGAKG